MNVLLTSAGRRTYLVDYFKRALGRRGQVVACDSSTDAPALSAADRGIIVPSVRQPDYINVLTALCQQYLIGMLIAVNEVELAMLAERAHLFREVGTIPVVSTPEVIATCQDKWQAYQFLRNIGIAVPATYLSIADAQAAVEAGQLQYPLILKPRWGVSSFGITRVENQAELAPALEWGKLQVERTCLATLCRDPEHAFLVQQVLEGAEFGMDVINDLEGSYAATLGRRKLAMRAGNTDRAVTVCDPVLDRLGARLGQHLGHVGCLDCDLIATEEGYFVIDLNPRFGGGYPFSHLAGADVPAALVAWANGEAIDPTWLRARPGIVASKFDALTILDPSVPLPAQDLLAPPVSPQTAHATTLAGAAG